MKISVREQLTKLLNTILILFLVFPVYGAEESRTGPAEKKSNETRSLEKSLIFPGWGQLHEKKYFKGILFITAELVAVTGAVISNRRGNSNYNKYRTSLNVDDAVYYRDETERFDRQRNLFIAAGIGVWIINMADIYLFKKKMKKKGLKVSLSKGINDEISFTINYSF
ncbi:MAG: DUF5683 domain-containing protein [Acidobacteriota bacterium]